MITGLHHVGISVFDLEAAIAFYTSQQAFEVVSRFEIANTALNRAMLQVDNPTARVALLRGTLGALELFEYGAARDQNIPDRAVYAAGIRHICLQSALSDTLYDGFVGAGATAHARPSGLGTGNSYVYIRDPEGNLIELEGTPWAPQAAVRPWFAHAAIVSPEIHRLVGFYAMLTGQSTTREGQFGPDQKFDTVAGIADVRFRGAWLRLPNAELEFWQYDHPQTEPAVQRDACAAGWNHICFESDDILADYHRLGDHGVVLHGVPQAFGTATVFFGRDPDGNIFEVLQPGPQATLTIAAMMSDDEGRAVDTARTAYRQRAAHPVRQP